MDYLIDNLDRFVAPDFTPSNEDILYARQRTTGTQTTTFITERYKWVLIDIGGQRPERQKWLDVIKEGIDCMIYFAALDEFNMESSEEKNKTKMEISLEVFSEVMKSEETQNVCSLIFLNKLDLFKKKIENDVTFKDFQTVFPDYKDDADVNKASEYIRSLFVEKVPGESAQDNLYVHTTCALDTRAMNIVFESIKDYIWKKRMEDAVSNHNF